MAKLRHLALHTANPEATAEFYKRAFDMEQIGPKNDSPVAEAIYLTDGTLNLTVLRFKSDEIAMRLSGSTAFGISHFGFWTESMDESKQRLRELGSECADSRDPGHVVFYEEKWKGPDGVRFDITDVGFPGALPPSGQEAEALW